MGTRLLALITATALASACTAPSAYERETLTTRRMQLDDEGGEAFLVRGVTRAREEGHVHGGAATGGGGGGGCGCN